MQIVIPTKNGDLPYSRIEMETFLRENLLLKNHMFIRMMALQEYNLNKDYYISVPIAVLLHWLLDRMIDESTKGAAIKVIGEKMGLAPARTAETYKIKGFLPREDNSQFMLDFTKQLANFIMRGLASRPSENEGIKLDELERYIDPQQDAFLSPPVPPGVSTIETFNPQPQPLLVIDQPLMQPKPAPVRKTRTKALTKPAIASPQEEVHGGDTASISMELLVKSIRGELHGFEEKFIYLENLINALESRIIYIENKLK